MIKFFTNVQKCHILETRLLIILIILSSLVITSSLETAYAICSTGPGGASLCAGADFSATFDKTNSQNTDFSRIVISGPPDKILNVKILDSTLIETISDTVTIGPNGKTTYAFDITKYSYGKYQAQVSDGISIIKLDFSVGPTTTSPSKTNSDKATLLIYTNVSWKADIQTSSNSTSISGNTAAQYSFACSNNDTYDVTIYSPARHGNGIALWTVANLIQNGKMLNVGVNHVANGEINLSGKCNAAQFPLSNNGMIYFTTDKSVYQYGDPIQISGYVLPDMQKTTQVLSSTIINSAGQAIKKDSTTFGTLNTFYFNVHTHGGLWKAGKYKVVLEIFGSKAESDILINPSGQKQSDMSSTNHIPIWFKGTTKNWSQGKISDDEFMQTVQYLTKQGILKVPYYNSPATSTQSLLSWIKTSASVWSNGKMSDTEFENALKYFNSR
jgi:hypothetical protein